ncbi:MAG: hypothetical protein GTN81_08895 [Proteobacteria bacterium]|nr:hypothetical protein [Pseudomonadota bacterium]
MTKTDQDSYQDRPHSAIGTVDDSGMEGNITKRRDRRKSRRIKDPILIFLYKDKMGHRTARPLDLSPEGIGIETSSALPVEEALQLAIIIGESQVNALGKVIYTKRENSGRFRSGIRFEKISNRNRGIINLYLEKTQTSGGEKKHGQNTRNGAKKTQAS